MRSTSVSRLAAAGLAVVVVDMVVSLARTGAPAYLVLLVSAIGGVGLVAAGRLWRGACVASRLTAILLAAAVITGQLLGASVGGPTGEGARCYPAAAGAVALAALVILLITLDARAVRAPDTEKPPYAL